MDKAPVNRMMDQQNGKVLTKEQRQQVAARNKRRGSPVNEHQEAKRQARYPNSHRNLKGNARKFKRENAG